MNKEIEDALHMILHCSLKDTEYETQLEQYKIVRKYITNLQQENKQLKDKLSKIETLIINHNCDTGDIYYKYNSKFLKSELKQRILEIVYEEESDNLRCEKEQFESMEYRLGDDE